MPRGYAPSRVDANQKKLTDLWRKMGVSVLNLSSVGKGCPDVLLGITTPSKGRINILVEIKDGNKPPSHRKLTPSENDFFESWKGQIIIINTELEAVDLISNILEGFY